MKKHIEKIENRITDIVHKNGKEIIISFLIGVLTYFSLMAADLVNDLDGIWHYSNFIAGDWEISLGRGLQRYADRARFGIVSSAFNTLLTLILISISNVNIIRTLKIKSNLYKYIILILLIANPIVCSSLTYSYMSVNFGLAYFFSVCTVLAIVRKNNDKKAKFIWSIIGGGILLGVAMAFYQAYICVTAIVLLLVLMNMLVEKEEIKEILLYVAKVFATIIVGGGFYLIITKLLLWRAGVEMATYKGAANVGLMSMITNLPASVAECFKQYWNYIYNCKMFSALEFIDIVIAGLGIVYIFNLIVQFIKIFKQKKSYAFIFLIAILFIPIASCVVLLIAIGNSMTTLMSAGMLMSIVLLGCIISEDSFWIKRIYYLFLIALAWFQLSAVINDQLALREGKDATITISECIVQELVEDGYLEEGLPIAFMGRPGNNPLFVQSTAYQMANGYARFGCWSTDPRNNRSSWSGVLNNFLGIQMNICNDASYELLRQTEEVKNMPTFPAEGSICVIDGIVVVKVSDVY